MPGNVGPARERQVVMTLLRGKCAVLVGLIASMVALLVACSSNLVGQAGSPHRDSTAARTLTPTCTAHSLRAQGGREGGGGLAHGDVEITNLAATPCILGAPHFLNFVSADRKTLNVQLRPAPTPLQPATIPSGKAALLSLAWSNWCHPNPGPLTVSITEPGVGEISGPFDGPPNYNYVPPCLASNQPSTVQFVGLALQG